MKVCETWKPYFVHNEFWDKGPRTIKQLWLFLEQFHILCFSMLISFSDTPTGMIFFCFTELEKLDVEKTF